MREIIVEDAERLLRTRTKYSLTGSGIVKTISTEKMSPTEAETNVDNEVVINQRLNLQIEKKLDYVPYDAIRYTQDDGHYLFATNTRLVTYFRHKVDLGASELKDGYFSIQIYQPNIQLRSVILQILIDYDDTAELVLVINDVVQTRVPFSGAKNHKLVVPVADDGYISFGALLGSAVKIEAFVSGNSNPNAKAKIAFGIFSYPKYGDDYLGVYEHLGITPGEEDPWSLENEKEEEITNE